jgi:hypothetical protein
VIGIVVASRQLDVDNWQVRRARNDIRGTALFCAKQQALAATLLASVLIVIKYYIIDEELCCEHD